jgi:hypothetical protein
MGCGAQACRGKNQLAEQLFVHVRISLAPHIWGKRRTFRGMLKKFVQQGRRRVETGGVPSGVR